DDGPVARFDTPHYLRLVQGPAVSERRVGQRELSDGHGRRALPDCREERETTAKRSLLPACVPGLRRHPTARLRVHSDARFHTETELDADLREPVDVDLLADRVKVRVTRLNDGVVEVHALVHTRATEVAPSEFVSPMAVDTRCRRDQAIGQGSKRREGLVCRT